MTPSDEIHQHIAARGRITFAEFMEVALYNPGNGYYTSGERVGVSGDYYTSPSVHPAFGALLAVQLFQMWHLLGRPNPFTAVESGAGNGLLSRDIVNAAEGLPIPFRKALRYVCIDRRTAAGLEAGLNGASRIASGGLPLRGVVGCVLSNELLDAMPVHQVTLEDGELKELYVVSRNGELALQTDTPSTSLLSQRLSSLGVRLQDGQIAEVNLALEGWIHSVARSLERGFVLAIDYGRLADDLYSPTERFRGTLTTYRNHLQTDRPLEHIGEQDMSAQVDFSTLASAAKEAGLDVMGHTSQAEFLRSLGIDPLVDRLAALRPRGYQSGRLAMRELVKPDGLGAFRVMALGMNVAHPELWGFHHSEEPAELVGKMPVPAPTPDHVDLLAGRYPWHQVEFDLPWEALWADDSPSP